MSNYEDKNELEEDDSYSSSNYDNKQEEPSPKDDSKNKQKKTMKNVGKKTLQIVSKAIGKILRFLVVTFGSHLLILFAIIVICYCAWDVVFDSRGKTQDYQVEDANEYNSIKKDNSTGSIIATDLSIGNKLTKAFYTYFSEKSLYVTVMDKDGNIVQKDPLQYNSPEFISKYGEADKRTLKDKYDKEKMFYLNPNALWSLDEFLNQNKFRFPEQFIKPVHYDPDTFELKQLTDENGKLTAESTKYTEQSSMKNIYKKDESDSNVLKKVYIDNSLGTDTFEEFTNGSQNEEKKEEGNSMLPDTSNSKEEGVWDYGFGSILNYKEFEEERKALGSFQTMNVWDISDEKMIYNVPLDSAEEMCKNEPDKYEGFDSSYPKDKEFEDKLPSGTSYMIDRITSPAGFVSNQIVCEWKDTGKKYSKVIELTKNVTVWREYERQVTSLDFNDLSSVSKPVYIDSNGNDVFESSYKDENGNEHFNVDKMEKYKKKEKESKTFRIEGEGTEHEKIPRYEGEPDLSQVSGSKYYIDYMTNYKAYVPENIMTSIGITDFTSRTGVEQEKLLKLLERHSFTGGTVGDIDLSGFEFGDGASSQNFMSAMHYYDDFVLWGETYGIDPMLLVAIASQESGGKHLLNGCSSQGCGIMQVEQPGIAIKSVTAYNFITKKEETMEIPNIDSVSSVKDNIRAGAMLQASRMKDSNYNMLFGLQAYNFGSGSFKLAVNKYASDNGKEFDDVLNDANDLGWIAYILDFHKHPNNYLTTPWNSNRGVPCSNPNCDEKGGDNHYGDPGYLKNVLKFYVGDGTDYPWVMKEDGTKVSMNGSEFQMGTGTPGGGSDSWIKNMWKKIIGNKNYIFPMMPPSLMPETTLYEYKMPKNQAEIVHKMMFVMEEKKHLSEYEGFTDEDWKSKFYLWFTNPIGVKWKGSGGLVDSKGMFSEGMVKPLSFSPLTIETAYTLPSHSGIDITAPIGTDVYAISDGEISETNDKGAKGKGKYVQINHSSGTKTIYGGLSEVLVKKGDKVKKGEVIGKTGNTHDKKSVLYLELNYQGKTIDPTWIISGNFSAGDYDMSEEDGVIIQQIIQLAHTKIGCQYTQAQGLRSGPNSFDCSGFVWWLYNTTTKSNIGSWTGEQDQFLNNYRVSPENLQPGDIMMNDNLSHVVLYIGKENGKDTIIHASNPTMGVIKGQYSNLTSKYPKIYRPIAFARTK